MIAIASGVAVLAMRDPNANRLDQEATRLASLFEAARAQSRSMGREVRWLPARSDREAQAGDFGFAGLPEGTTMPTRWLTPGVQAELADPRGIVLGPEPVIGAQQVTLRLEQQHLTIATDGLGPFGLRADAEASAEAR